jgi:hypothetical protein
MDVIGLGSARAPRVLVLAPRQNMLPGKSPAIAEARSPAREARALPEIYESRGRTHASTTPQRKYCAN